LLKILQKKKKKNDWNWTDKAIYDKLSLKKKFIV
jgi:hypothetical protein